MVASSVSSPVKAPPLSYAERAKKAQNIRSPIEVIPSQQPRPSQPQPPVTPITPSLSSTSAASAKSPSITTPLTPSPTSAQSPTAQTPLPRAQAIPEPKLVNGDLHTPTSSTTKQTSATELPPSPQKPAPVNVWDRRKEEFAARNASVQKSSTTASQPSTSASRPSAVTPASSSREDPVQTDNTASVTETKQPPPMSLAADDDDDPFVVRTDRAPRPAVLPASNSDEWPEVGKPVPPSTATSSGEISKSEESRSTGGDNTQTAATRKGGAPKWVPLPLDPPANAQSQSRRDPQFTRGNRQTANISRPPSNPGQSRNSRSQSGRTSANQSTSNSRVPSNVGSAQSSPRNPRNRRLPGEEVPTGATNAPTNRSSRTGSPHHPNSSQSSSTYPATDMTNLGTNYGPYLSPAQGASSYYPPQPPALPPVNPAIYHSPSHGPPPGLPPDQSLPMPPPVHAYPYVYPAPYIPYEYVPSSAPYPYWNGPHSHPGSGRHSPAYPPSAAPSNYAVASLPHHVQQHFYPQPPPPPPPMQPQAPVHSYPIRQQQQQAGSTAGTNSADKLSLENSPNGGAVPPPPVESEININGGTVQKSTSVIFGSIDDISAIEPPSDAPDSGVVSDAKDNIEKVFKSLAIGIDSTDAIALKNRKSTTKFSKSGESLKEDGDIVVDPALVKDSESIGEMKWKFGNEGLASPAGGGVVEFEATTIVQSVAVEGDHGSFGVTGESPGKEFEAGDPRYHFGSNKPADIPRDDSDAGRRERVEGTSYVDGAERMEDTGFMNPQGPSNGRRRGAYSYGYERGGYSGRRGGRMNGYGRGNRGYNRGGSNHNYNGNTYSQRQGPPPFSVTPPPSFQGIPPPMDGSYYPGPPRPPLATYIPTGFDPYAPLPPPPPQPAVAPGAASPSGHAAPPLPIPLSHVGFHLDATRYYLLGQLEYYLSPQNMAQDFFLRQHMDSKGWIAIGLLASFNRVKRLTQDYQLVREVLMFSSLVQVKDYFVRMGGWEQFVLPDAPKSTVESEEDYSSYIPLANPLPHHGQAVAMEEGNTGEMGGTPSDLGEGGYPEGQQWNHPGEGEEEAEEEEEEDDVVFVMANDEGEGMWSHEKRT